MRHRTPTASFAIVLAGLLALHLAAHLNFNTTAMAQPPADYYSSVDPTNTATLRLTLHEVIDDHTRFPYTSTATDTWDILEAADEDSSNPTNILDLYRNTSLAKEGGGNSYYNREHSWPKSYGFPDNVSSNLGFMHQRRP